MTKSFSPYRITTDGSRYRIEQGFWSTDPKKDVTWTPISIEMLSKTEALAALNRLESPPVWRPISK